MAARSSCFSMALALTLGKHKATAKKLVVGSTVMRDEVDGVPTIVSSAITMSGDVPGLNAEYACVALRLSAGVSQGRFATVRRIAASSSASRLCRASGTMRRPEF